MQENGGKFCKFGKFVLSLHKISENEKKIIYWNCELLHGDRAVDQFVKLRKRA